MKKKFQVCDNCSGIGFVVSKDISTKVILSRVFCTNCGGKGFVPFKKSKLLKTKEIYKNANTILKIQLISTGEVFTVDNIYLDQITTTTGKIFWKSEVSMYESIE